MKRDRAKKETQGPAVNSAFLLGAPSEGCSCGPRARAGVGPEARLPASLCAEDSNLPWLRAQQPSALPWLLAPGPGWGVWGKAQIRGREKLGRTAGEATPPPWRGRAFRRGGGQGGAAALLKAADFLPPLSGHCLWRAASPLPQHVQGSRCLPARHQLRSHPPASVPALPWWGGAGPALEGLPARGLGDEPYQGLSPQSLHRSLRCSTSRSLGGAGTRETGRGRHQEGLTRDRDSP